MESLEQLGKLATLEDVLEWANRQDPPARLVDVIEQDEFSIDVIFLWRASRHLAFDTT